MTEKRTYWMEPELNRIAFHQTPGKKRNQKNEIHVLTLRRT